jgi:hypothetical protein
MPRTLGPMNGIDWVPVDLVGRVIGDLVMLSSEKESSQREEKKMVRKSKYMHSKKEVCLVKKKDCSTSNLLAQNVSFRSQRNRLLTID